MIRHCEEPHCLEFVPDDEFQLHQDRHLAERLAAEEFEQNQSVAHEDEVLAHALADNSNRNGIESIIQDGGLFERDDYGIALDLNRRFRLEEEEVSFRNLQVTRQSIHAEARRREKLALRIKSKRKE